MQPSPDAPSAVPGPPAAATQPFCMRVHGDLRQDDYAWLRDPSYPEVRDPAILSYLKAENSYAEAQLAPQAALKARILEELRGRIPAEDDSVPVTRDAFAYQWRYTEGDEHPRYWQQGPQGERCVLDLPELAAGKAYFDLGSLAVAPTHDQLAYAVDLDGSEQYSLYLRCLASGETRSLGVHRTQGSLIWDAAGTGLFYVALDEAQRPRHVRYLALASGQTRTLYSETDDTFWLGIDQSSDRRYLLIEAAAKNSSEVHCLALDAPDGQPAVYWPRRPQVEYSLDHHPEGTFVYTNRDRSEFAILRGPAGELGQAKPSAATLWYAPEGEHHLEDITLTRKELAVLERRNGQQHLRLLPLHSPETGRDLAFDEATFSLGFGAHAELPDGKLRVVYESLTTPPTTFELDLATDTRRILKQRQVPGGYDPAAYDSQRLTFTSADGTEVPVSYVRRRDQDGPVPTLLYVYGAYGITIDPYFSASRLSLLDRGVAFAIAHVRGGSDLGRTWYDQGKLDRKENTFADTTAAAEALLAQGLTKPGALCLMGGSAGGMTVGTVITRRPELFCAAVAAVPFVDCLNTMLDSSLPLTPGEFVEWGDPSGDPAAYARIKGYAPYELPMPPKLPHLLITAGLTDPRVTYWEPAKWCAALRRHKAGPQDTTTQGATPAMHWPERDEDTRLLLHTNMDAGHRGQSGRYAALDEVALEYTFLLACLAADGHEGLARP